MKHLQKMSLLIAGNIAVVESAEHALIDHYRQRTCELINLPVVFQRHRSGKLSSGTRPVIICGEHMSSSRCRTVLRIHVKMGTRHPRCCGTEAVFDTNLQSNGARGQNDVEVWA